MIKTKNHLVEFSDKAIKDFWSFVIKTDVCWFWRGPQTRDGYGIFRVPKNPIPLYCHRISFVLKHGKIPETKPELDHLCKNRLCCNPKHLEPVNRYENFSRRLEAPRIENNIQQFKRSLGTYHFDVEDSKMLSQALHFKIWRFAWLNPKDDTDFIRIVDLLNERMKTGQIDYEEMVDYHKFWYGGFDDTTFRNKYRLEHGCRFYQIPPNNLIYSQEKNNSYFVYEDPEWYRVTKRSWK